MNTFTFFNKYLLSRVPVLIFFITVCNYKMLAQAPSALWKDVPENAITAKGVRYTIPQKLRALALDVAGMRQLLARAPKERSTSLRNSNAIITLPLPDGTFARFRFVESSIIAPGLASRFPEIRTFQGMGVDDRSLTAAFDLTPLGFHGMIHSAETGLSFIDPHSQGDIQNYIAYAKKDYVPGANKTFIETDVIGTETENARKIAQLVEERRAQRMQATNTNERPSGNQLRTYRIAIAATGEYTTFHGGTVSAALSAIITTLNRVNFIYIREVAVKMVLVSNETSIIYTNSSTDPYTNGSPGTMINQAQTDIDTKIGNANYDIGHVFGTNSGGLAGLGVVCQAGIKARGVTGSGAPIGDAFDVDYVAHEIGHQFGANHTFNGNESSCAGNRKAEKAYEPGSGSTIMGYAGICGSQNLQPNSDSYFHTASYDEIFAYTETGAGNSCAVITSPDNTAPLPTIVTTNHLTIPKQTPFTITGSATDAHNDPITYCWEQYNLGPAGHPNFPSGDAPIFRSFTGTSSGSRTFPKQSDLLNNTQTIGELLPTYARTLRFNLTVRDNYSGGGGVDWAFPLNVNVSGTAGPFLVTSPNTAVTLNSGSSQTVTWNVSGTNAAPINTTNVNIRLSTDGGLTFPTILIANTPNDGSQTIILPNISTTTARIKIEAVGNIFFDVSNFNFTIKHVLPTVNTFKPASGPAGVGVYIKGTNLTNVSAVRFNGVASSQFYAASSTLLYATVPTGATTGKIQVETASGVGTSASSFTVAAISSKWVNKTGLTSPRLQHGTIAVNGKIYVFGGHSSSGHLNSLEIYNPSTNTWTAGAPMPVATRGMAFALGSNGSIYMFGGATTTNTVASVYRYTPSTNTWTAMASMPVAVFEAAAAATSNGKIYVFGGEPVTAKTTSTNATRIYDIATNTWTSGANMPVGLQQHSAVVGKDGKIYIIGGRALSAKEPLGLVRIYNPATNAWSSGAAMPIPKVQFGAARAGDGKIYVVGGKASEPNHIGPFFHTVEIYNPSTNSWANGPVLPVQFGQQTAINLNDNLYAVGGSNGTYRGYNFQLTVAPVAPTALTASAVSSSKINLTWTDNSLNETGFVIERAIAPTGPFSVIASVGSNVKAYSNTGLSAGTTYYYRVKATNTAGSSPYSNVVSATTASARDIYTIDMNKDVNERETAVNMLSVNPNPVRDIARILFTVDQDQRVQLGVFDMNGKLVGELFNGAVEAGKAYQFEWRVGALANGNYISRLVTQKGVVTQQIVVLR